MKTRNVKHRWEYFREKHAHIIALPTFAAIFFIVNLNAQNIKIQGTITSVEDGLPLPGVNIVVKGTTIGTTSDNGRKLFFTPPRSIKSFSESEKLEIILLIKSLKGFLFEYIG